MKKRPFENRVIIIGADHHNTLAAIRAFGQEGCEIVVVVHGHALERKKIQVFSSKYVDQKQTYIIENDEKVLIELLSQYGNTQKKDILFPASDFAEYVIDSNCEVLENSFIVPGFVGQPGKVCQMMDKWNQYLFAQEHRIPMAPTFLIQTEKPQIPPELSFPCIIKPKVSAYGSKDEIKRCEKEEDLLKTLDRYRASGHTDGLVQEYLTKKYEVCSFGSISSGTIVGCTILKLREQLQSGQSFSVLLTDNSFDDGGIKDDLCIEGISVDEIKRFQQLNRRVLKVLRDDCYDGQYDIEYLICENGTYLNEINYRHSGNGFALVNERINNLYDWAASRLKLSDAINRSASVRVGDYLMVELSDIIYIKRRELTLPQWIRDVKRASSFAVFDIHDMKATKRYYKDRLIGLARKGFGRFHGIIHG